MAKSPNTPFNKKPKELKRSIRINEDRDERCYNGYTNAESEIIRNTIGQCVANGIEKEQAKELLAAKSIEVSGNLVYKEYKRIKKELGIISHRGKKKRH